MSYAVGIYIAKSSKLCYNPAQNSPRTQPNRHMTTSTARKTSKVRLNSVMLRETTIDHLAELAEGVGENSAAGIAAKILEAASELKPENYHIAIAEFVKIGRK